MSPPQNRRFLPVRTAAGAWKIKLKFSCRLTGDNQFQPSESEPEDEDKKPVLDLLCQQKSKSISKSLKMDGGRDA